MKVLLAASPPMGHLNPLLAIGYMLIKEGHEVVGVSGTVMGSRIEGIGAKFRPFSAEADLDLRDIATAFPEIKTIAPGHEMSRFYMRHVFIDPIRAQQATLREVLRDFPADVIIADNGFLVLSQCCLGRA